MQVALLSLSSCLGCQAVFLGLEEYLYTIIGENRISFAPFLMDSREIAEVDLALVEGTVRHAGHFARAREVREKAARVAALGTCACFGGVQGLADRFAEEEIMRRRFGGEPCEGAPGGVKRLLPLDSFIKVDYYLPGCPPTQELMKGFLQAALAGTQPLREGSTLCAECRVSCPELPQPGPRRTTEAPPRKGECLIESGYACMGPLTRDGCGARCPTEMGVPCRGCRGPSDRALLDPGTDLKGETVRRLARATGKKAGEVEEAVNDPAHTCFMFCLAEPALRRRRREGSSPYIHRMGGR
ncbi:MAG: hypothetical protein H5T73_02375 [Actinobacteria bacterium]|nr:hypothetical protein [Actinomycetota bacterium]